MLVKCFTLDWLTVSIAGLDLMDMGSNLMSSDLEPSRRAHMLRKLILFLQDSFRSIEKCPQPIIAAVHSACVGGGVDMICSCDIRLCSSDAWFQIKVCNLHKLPKNGPESKPLL